LNDLPWSDVLGGPLPEFPKTPMLKRPAGSGPAPSQANHTPNGVDKEKKKQSASAKQTPNSAAASPSNSGKKKKPLTKNEKAKLQKDEKTRKAVCVLFFMLLRCLMRSLCHLQIEKQQEELKFIFNQAHRFDVDDVERWEQTDRLLTEDQITELKTLVKEHRDHVCNFLLFAVVPGDPENFRNASGRRKRNAESEN
jgi:hypothetical protein